MIDRYTEIHGIEMRSSASTTFKRRDLKRGFDAVESYYLERASAIRGKDEIDLETDPPPDLVIKIELSRSLVNKQALFAAMGIPEVWRYDGCKLWIRSLHERAYHAVSESGVLRGFPSSLAQELLPIRAEEDETTLIRRFVQNVI